jgi:predicted DNA-binding transcriptional regulator
MPKALTEEEVRSKVESIGYDRDRLEYVGYVPNCKGEDGKRVPVKIRWLIKATGEVAEQDYDRFTYSVYQLKRTKKEIAIEYKNKVESSKYFDRERLKCLEVVPEYRDKNNKRVFTKIIWISKKTNEIIKQDYVTFLYHGNQPIKTIKELKTEYKDFVLCCTHFDHERLECLEVIPGHSKGKNSAKIKWKIKATGEMVEQNYYDFKMGLQPCKTKNEYKVFITSRPFYDHRRLEYIDFISSQTSSNKKNSAKIKWKIKATGEMVEQAYSSFIYIHRQPNRTIGEYQKEAVDIIKKRGLESQYKIEVKNEKGIWVYLTRTFDKQQGLIRLTQLRKGGLPKQFVYKSWDLESAIKYFILKQSKLAKYIQIFEYHPGGQNGEATKVKIKEIETGRTKIVEFADIIKGMVPRNFRAYQRPENKTPTKLYFCKTNGYSGKEGIHLTVGITTRTAAQRYKNIFNGLLLQEYFITKPTLNSLIKETDIINEIKDTLGLPEAGHEAWRFTPERESIIKEIFLRHTKDILPSDDKNNSQ